MKSFLAKFNFQKDMKSSIMFLSLLGIWIIFSFLSKGIFIDPRNLSNLARQTTVVGILSIGMMFVIVAGHIDLSVGSLLGFCGTVAAVLQVWKGWGTLPTILVTLLLGMLLGTWNGLWVAYLKVPAFIITLGGLLMFKGAMLGLSKSSSIAPMNESFSYFGQAYLPKYFGSIIAALAILSVIWSTINNRRSKKRYNFKLAPVYTDVLKIVAISFFIILAVIVFNKYQGLPVPVVIILLLAILFSFVANKTVFGREVYSIGGNIEAARLSGIKTKRDVLIVFIISGGLAALAGIVLTARLDAATAAAGNSMELDAIASCVIGGTSMVGGVGRIPGVLIGALIMASLDNGMSLINLENFWQFIVKGMVLILAVWADTATSKK
jgi:D-xylose transport system permease protein